MNDKEAYRLLCEDRTDIPLFMQHWWMEAVCIGKNWNVLLERDRNGVIIGAMPYLLRQKLWVRYIVLPQQTQINGIWIQPLLTQAEQETLYDHFMSRLREMNIAYYYQQYPLYSKAPTYLAQHGFNVRLRYTYRIEDLSDLDQLISSFSKNKKRQLQKALSLHVDFSLSPDDFYHFHTVCLNLQGKVISYSQDFFLTLYQATHSRNQGQIIGIRDANNALLAALFLVWDEQTSYFLIPCHDKNYAHTGASALLVLEAIKLARQHSQTFDFEGSMIKNVANSYRQFGSTKTPYYSVERYYKPVFRLALLYNKIRTRKKR